MDLIEIHDLRTYYTKPVVRAVDGFSISIRQGEVLGLAGESGCGKSTLALSILKLLPSNARIFSGQILLRGEGDLVTKTEREMEKIRWRKVSIIFQGAMN